MIRQIRQTFPRQTFPLYGIFCINVSGMYWYLEKQELDMHQFL